MRPSALNSSVVGMTGRKQRMVYAKRSACERNRRRPNTPVRSATRPMLERAWQQTKERSAWLRRILAEAEERAVVRSGVRRRRRRRRAVVRRGLQLCSPGLLCVRMDVTDALLEAAAELDEEASEFALSSLLRLHLHFAKQAATRCSVLAAQGPLWCLHALTRFPEPSRAAATAVEVLTALGPLAELCGPAAPAWTQAEPQAGRSQMPARNQRLSPALEEARRLLQPASASAPPRVVAVHCGGAGACAVARLARLNAHEALTADLEAHLEGAQQLQGVALHPVAPSDARAGLAGGCGVFATRDWEAHQIVGAYTAWVTCQREFDDAVPLLQRLNHEEYAVHSSKRLRLRAREPREALMFVAYPNEASDATSQFNDWRRIGADGVPNAGAEDAGAPSCELLEVAHRGWLYIYVATTRALQAGEEMTVQYPDDYWMGRVAAMRAHEAAAAAVHCGVVSAQTAPGPLPAPSKKKKRAPRAEHA